MYNQTETVTKIRDFDFDADRIHFWLLGVGQCDPQADLGYRFRGEEERLQSPSIFDIRLKRSVPSEGFRDDAF
jgi:hypothetical protein